MLVGTTFVITFEKDGTFTRDSSCPMSFPLCQATWGDNVQSPTWTRWKQGPSLGQETNEAEGRPDRRPGSVVLERNGCSTR